MRQNEYNELLSKIKCSDDFRSRMQEKLSAAPVEMTVYEDVVSGTEVITAKRRFSRFAAMAAAFVLVCGAVGGGVYHFANMHDNDENIEQGIEDDGTIYSHLKVDIDKCSMDVAFCLKGSVNGGYPDCEPEKFFEYMDKLDMRNEVEEGDILETTDSLKVVFADDDYTLAYIFEVYANGDCKWTEKHGEDERTTYHSFVDGEKVYTDLVKMYDNSGMVKDTEIDFEVTKEEIEEFLDSGFAKRDDDRAFFYPADRNYNIEYTVKNKTELRNELLKFEWERADGYSIGTTDYWLMGFMISNEGYMKRLDGKNFKIYKLKKVSDLEAFHTVLNKYLIPNDYGKAVSKEEMKNALQKYTSDTFVQWLSGPLGAPQGRDCYETTARYYTLNDREGLINEIASFEWITCDYSEVEERAYFKAYDGCMSLKGAYQLGVSEYSYGGEVSVYPLGYMCINERDYKLKNENDVEKLGQIFEKYLVIEEKSRIAEIMRNGLTNFDNLKGHFTYEQEYSEVEDQIIEGYMSYDAQNEKLYMKGDGHLSYQKKENTIELIMNGHDNSAFKTVEKETGNIDRIGIYRYSNGYASPPPDNYVYICKDLEKALAPRFIHIYNSAKQENYQITESDGKIELYSRGATDGCYTRIILTEKGQLISYENIGPSYKTIFKLDDYVFDSPDFTMEDVGPIYESIIADEEKVH